MYAIVHRIADRFGPGVAAAFVKALDGLATGVDEGDLAQALASGDVGQVEAALATGRLGTLFAGDLEDRLRRTATATGTAGADVLSGVTSIEVQFNAADPQVIEFAHSRSAALVTRVTADVREAIRVTIAAGASEGLTVRRQARAIRQVVGLPADWVEAPFNLARELREGRFNASRRLSAAEKAEIRKRVREETIDEAFVERMQGRYAASLRNRRALNIARTETMASANHGMRTGWRQAKREGVLPDTARRHWVTTPDDRLRETHAAIPGMNPDGVPIDGGTYDTPLGPSSGPPLETNCRCSEGLVFPGGGML